MVHSKDNKYLFPHNGPHLVQFMVSHTFTSSHPSHLSTFIFTSTNPYRHILIHHLHIHIHIFTSTSSHPHSTQTYFMINQLINGVTAKAYDYALIKLTHDVERFVIFEYSYKRKKKKRKEERKRKKQKWKKDNDFWDVSGWKKGCEWMCVSVNECEWMCVNVNWMWMWGIKEWMCAGVDLLIDLSWNMFVLNVDVKKWRVIGQKKEEKKQKLSLYQ